MVEKPKFEDAPSELERHRSRPSYKTAPARGRTLGLEMIARIIYTRRCRAAELQLTPTLMAKALAPVTSQVYGLQPDDIVKRR